MLFKGISFMIDIILSEQIHTIGHLDHQRLMSKKPARQYVCPHDNTHMKNKSLFFR